MLQIRRLNTEGNGVFLNWLISDTTGQPPASLMDNPNYSEPALSIEIDAKRIFNTQLEFGEYINEILKNEDFAIMTSEESDGIWNWLSVVYFSQLAPEKRNKFWRFIVTRKGAVGSLAYRQILRTAYEIYYIHQANAQICLSNPLHIWAELTEQLTSRQKLAHNTSFFQAASVLYVIGGKIRKGAASKPKKRAIRKPGDKTGYGSVRRLAIALARLDLTYDTGSMGSGELIGVLPKEFGRWDSLQSI